MTCPAGALTIASDEYDEARMGPRAFSVPQAETGVYENTVVPTKMKTV